MSFSASANFPCRYSRQARVSSMAGSCSPWKRRASLIAFIPSSTSSPESADIGFQIENLCSGIRFGKLPRLWKYNQSRLAVVQSLAIVAAAMLNPCPQMIEVSQVDRAAWLRLLLADERDRFVVVFQAFFEVLQLLVQQAPHP